MAEPSLSEITGIRGDADLALGASGAFGQVVNPDNSIQYLAAASQAKSLADKYTYGKFKEELDSRLANFNTIDVQGVMDSDNPEIIEQYKNLAGSLAENYDVLMNPFKDPVKNAQLRREEADLRGKIAQSKGQKMIIDQHKTFLNSHPSFNTETNQAKVLAFQNTPREQREAFTLDTPFNFDPLALSKAANDVARQKLASAVTDGKYITKEQRTQILKDAYDEAWNAASSTQDAFGRTIRQNAEDAFSKLPSSERTQYGNDVGQWFKSVGSGLMQQDQIDLMSIDEDQYGVMSQQFKNQSALQNDAQAHDAWQSSMDRDIQRQRLAMENEVVKRGQVDVRQAGALKAAVLAQAASTGNVSPQNLQLIYGDNNPIEVKTGGGTDDTGRAIPEIKETKPRISIIKSEKTSDGKLKIYRRDNKTGKQIDAIVRSLQDVETDMNNILGRDNALTVSRGYEEYLKENNIQPGDLTALQNKFNYREPESEKFTAPNGTSYSKQQLKDLGYTDAMIQQAINLGNLKK